MPDVSDVPDASQAPAISDPAPAGDTARWLRPAMKRLLADEPAAAGKIVLHLLPAQSRVSDAVVYDLLVGPTCLAVTVRDGRVRFDILAAPRSLEEVDFRIEGDLAGLGRLLVYGRLRRRLSRGVAAVHGSRGSLAALTALVQAPLSLSELLAAGVQLDPELALRLVAGMIDPSWTRGQRFTVAHEDRSGRNRTYLHVRDGEAARVSQRPPLGPVAATIMCPDEQLLPLLAGGSAPDATVLGALGPVELLREWIVRAQRSA